MKHLLQKIELFYQLKSISNVKVDYEEAVKNTLLNIGYDDESKGFDANNCIIDLYIEGTITRYCYQWELIRKIQT